MANLYVCFDTETGGLNENTSDLLTAFFCVMDEDYKILEELNLKLKPNEGRIPVAEAGALKVNGINIQQHLADPETTCYAEGKAKLIEMLSKYLKKQGKFSNLIGMGYNILGFDIRWIQKHLLDQETFQSILHYKSWDVMQDVDFLKRAGWFPKSLGSLTTVVDYLEIPKRNAHTAKDDVMMTIDVAKKIMEMMKSKKENGGTGAGTDLISLLEIE